ncbi:PSP1 domain-containing protein [Blumeria hordei DH14]|uniref:PSP1 domain-containing protein n=1 Tax=Blumeria graminis f. sp. hordei (strain DH14) TaxID=546991 RepID=N1J9R6_BLUG1|nr:PSP1 domain-containing protein [Blumeria hordei DH14]
MSLNHLKKWRSTPDSETSKSSGFESHKRVEIQTVPQRHLSVQKSSQLNEINPVSEARKLSFASNSMTQTVSYLNTPSIDGSSRSQLTQSKNISRGPQAHSTFPFSNGIWNTENRKESPSRLVEVLPSPKSTTSPTSPESSLCEDSQKIPSDWSINTPIPFAIPLHPTPKAYRSQSYSVGQLDLGPPEQFKTQPCQTLNSRGRFTPHSGLQHRPSRPSMLSEMSRESILGNLKEDDDYEDEQTIYSDSKISCNPSDKKTIDLAAHENELLNRISCNYRLRSLSYSDDAQPCLLRGTQTEELESAIDEIDDANDYRPVSLSKEYRLQRSDHTEVIQSGLSKFKLAENQRLENFKKTFWQSSLDFGGISNSPHSRRHSFANIPTRNNLFSSYDQLIPTNARPDKLSCEAYSNNSKNHAIYSHKGRINSYRAASQAYSKNSGTYSSQSYYKAAYPHSDNPQHDTNGADMQPNMIYNAPNFGKSLPLFIVLFKCYRSGVFYIQKGTGLSVKPGDSVIVEADRGTDLGTVSCANIDWVTAKGLHENYCEDHYKRLMMFSQNSSRPLVSSDKSHMTSTQCTYDNFAVNVDGSSHVNMPESRAIDFKPKIIKRLAQQHEVQALSEKEVKEATAKRVCVQKVQDHGLHMEILDAEFQMDWKKLTFYYFADTYVNFNSLVADLFRIYKTRIWMSAINPASHASSSNGDQVSSYFGPSVGNQSVQTKYPFQSFEISRPIFDARAQRVTQNITLPAMSTQTDPYLALYLTPHPSIKFSKTFGTEARRDTSTTSKFVGSINSYGNIQGPINFANQSTQFSSLSRSTVISNNCSRFQQNLKEFRMNNHLGLSINYR